jgi:hypothetical protein
MRTKSSNKVKHSPRRARVIHHCSRETREDVSMPDERDDALEPALADGRYDAFILSAEPRDRGVALSCAITTGPHRGDVVDIVSSTISARDPFALVGLPCTLVVAGAVIRVEN